MDFHIHPYAPGDSDAVIDLLKRTFTRDPIPPGRFIRQVLLDPNFRPEGALTARDNGGGLLGFCLAIARQVPLENAPPDGDRGWSPPTSTARCSTRPAR